MGFVPNRGQTHAKVAFTAKTSPGTVFVTRRGELVYSLRGEGGGWSLSEAFIGGRPVPTGGRRTPAGVSYFVGEASTTSREPLPTYASIRLADVWEGIEVSLRLSGGSVEKLFTIAPGFSPNAIRMAVRGAEGLYIGSDGSLVAATGLGEVLHSADRVPGEKGRTGRRRRGLRPRRR